MVMRSGRLVLGAAAAVVALALGPAAQAEDFLSALFGAFGRPQAPMTPLPYASEGNSRRSRKRSSAFAAALFFRRLAGLLRAHLRRTLFPDFREPATRARRRPATVSVRRATPRWSTAAISIMPSPRAESPIPNCRMRFATATRLVAGCTCNGKDPTGLASVRIEDDPTLRRGDIVAGGGGLMVAGRGADRRGASLNLSPAPEAVRSHYRRVPVVASQ